MSLTGAVLTAAAGWTGLLAGLVWCGWRWQRVTATAARHAATTPGTAPTTPQTPPGPPTGPQTDADALELWYLLPAHTPAHEETR